jgi:phenylpropionate dioxygenase-like ring-hydroxylating dioxygenase large terminal subunit
MIATDSRRWPAEGLTRVPYWVYSDPGIYAEEQARIFRGPTWNFLCLEAELPRLTAIAAPASVRCRSW